MKLCLKNITHLCWIISFTFTIISCGSRSNEGQSDNALLDLNINSSHSRSSSEISKSSTGTATSAIILAVNQSHSSVGLENYIFDAYDKGMLNLSTNQVSLSLPLDTPLRIIQATFSTSYTLEQITTNKPKAMSVGISEPLTIGSGTSTLSVNIQMSSIPKKIESFQLLAAENSGLESNTTGTIDEENSKIELIVPGETTLTALKPVISITGTAISPASGTAVDFSNPVTYTVTGEDNSTKTYSVSVKRSLRAAGTIKKHVLDSVSFKMAYAPGNFTYMAGTGDSVSKKIPNPFWIGETEVTYELWNTVYTWALSNGYSFSNTGTQGDGGNGSYTNQHPVTTINWRDAMVWLNALTEYYNEKNGTILTYTYYSDLAYEAPLKSSLDGSFGSSTNATAGSFDSPYVRSDATGFRFLTVEEWEFAARYKSDNGDRILNQTGEYTPGNNASGATADYNNDTATGEVAVYALNATSTAAVKSKSSNGLGLYDMSGNIWEWMFNSTGTGRNRVGGAWDSGAINMRLAGSVSFEMDSYLETGSIGLRIAQSSYMIPISGGSFQMGDSAGGGASNEQPTHSVTIGEFYISNHEVTNGDFEACETAGSCTFKGSSVNEYNIYGRYVDGTIFTDPNYKLYPIHYISWNDSQDYITWLNSKSKQTYRMCTEAEWEYAARAGTTTLHSHGGGTSETDLRNAEWVGDGGAPRAVMSRNTSDPMSTTNPWGLYDMHGNVREWVQDYYHSDYNGAPNDGSAWLVNPGNDNRVFRGGDFQFLFSHGFYRSASRSFISEGSMDAAIGLRLCASP